MNNKAYTLLEMLMVLLIVSAIFFIMSFNYYSINTNNILQRELEFLGSMIQSMQLKSLVTNKESEVILGDEEVKCLLDGKEVYSHVYTSPIEYSSNFKDNEIHITEDGMLRQGGTIKYEYNNKSKEIVINIATGRYRIE